MPSFGKLLKEARIRKKLTLREVAEFVGVSAMYISQLEHEERVPTKSQYLPKISVILGLDPEEMIKKAFEFNQKSQIEKIKPDMYLSIARKLQSATPETLQQVEMILKREEGF